MNDIRRTILWVVFGFSMILLWDQWQVYSGHKATFFPGNVKTATVDKASAAPSSSVPSAVPAINTAAGSAQPTGTAAQIAAIGTVPAAPREQLIVASDVLKLTFDTEGGTLLKTEFLNHVDMADKSKRFVLLDNSKERTYVAQTGLIAGAGGGAFPTHKTVMTVAPGERTL